MAEEYRDAIHWYAGNEEFACESVAESVSMPLWNLGEFEESLEAPLPLSHGTMKRRRPRPKIKTLGSARSRLQGLNHEIGKNAVDRRITLLSVEKESIFLDAIDAAPHRVANPHSAVSKEQNESTEPLRVPCPCRFGVEINSR
jgi:hypothetical protein